MHAEAMEFLRAVAPLVGPRARVCELGSCDVNGSPRALWQGPGVTYVGVDARPGPGVDVVADARAWRPPPYLKFDLALSTEVLEHCPDAGLVCGTAWDVLAPGGVFLVTCAGPGRAPHSGVDGGPLPGGEYYRNVTPGELAGWLSPFRVRLVHDRGGQDLYALAVK